MSKYTIEPVWPSPAADLRQAVVLFWASESAVAAQDAESRSQQLVCVAKTSTGEVAGVSTAYPKLVPHLGFPCFFYRSFVGRGHRTSGLKSTDLVRRLLYDSYRHLNERFLEGSQSNVLGLFLEVENRMVMQRRRELVWTDFGANVVFRRQERERQSLQSVVLRGSGVAGGGLILATLPRLLGRHRQPTQMQRPTLRPRLLQLLQLAFRSCS